jgi:hypothetical protein
MALALFSAGLAIKMAYIKVKLQRKLYYNLNHDIAEENGAF